MGILVCFEESVKKGANDPHFVSHLYGDAESSHISAELLFHGSLDMKFLGICYYGKAVILPSRVALVKNPSYIF